MLLFLYFSVILLAFYLLARVCDDYFVDSLEAIAADFKMSSDVAGATLMAVGSSAPELFISLFAVFTGGGENAAVGAGTIVGSALFNLLVIVGASAVARTIHVPWQPLTRDLLFYTISVVWLLISFWDGKITALESIVFLLLYVLYILVVLRWRSWFPYEDQESDEEPDSRVAIDTGTGLWGLMTRPIDFCVKLLFSIHRNRYAVFTLSILLIAGLSWALVEAAVEIAHILDIPKVIIGLTILAIGTSVPDAISSVIVARRGQGSMATANAIGSNIFDILFGLGVPWLIVIVAYNKSHISVGSKNLIFSTVVLLASIVLLLMFFILRRWRLGKISGLVLIGTYVGYVLYEVLSLLFI